MPETAYAEESYAAQNSLRDIEEKMRLVKERILLLGKTQIDEREKTFSELQELKRTVLELKEENRRLKEIVRNMSEQLQKTARKEELAMLQRQFDLFREQ